MINLQELAQTLNKRGFQTQVCQTTEEAKAAALALVAPGASIGIGGSVTVQELGIYEALEAAGHPIYWHWKSGPSVLEQARATDVYFSSTNALLSEGTFINIDGNGNRVGAMFSGPKRVVLIVGRNKVVDGGWEAGIARIKEFACPANARRLNLKTPCAATGKCNDCNSPQRMCKVTVKMERPSGLVQDVHVILVDADMGY